MESHYQNIIAGELRIRISQVTATADLLADGATVPFISRYRKEATGSLDEVKVAAIRDRLAGLADLAKRRQTIIESLTKRDLLTDELTRRLEKAENLTSLEDIYLPYKPKRRTRAMIACERGLEPLARDIFKQDRAAVDALSYVNKEKGVESVEDARTGARDIIAEWISEDQGIRAILRKTYAQKGVIVSTVVKKNREIGAKYRDYFDWSESVAKAPGHRLLAMFRGEKEKVLSLSVRPPEELVLPLLRRHFVKDETGDQVALAAADSYKRLLNQQTGSVNYIAVLGSGHVSEISLPVTSQIGGASLYRIVEAKRISKLIPQADLIILGGIGYDPIPNARIVEQVALLIDIPPQRIITREEPRDTEQEAFALFEIVRGEPFVLVTSANHMKRAISLCKRLGMHPIPAPTDYIIRNHHVRPAAAVLPSPQNLALARMVIYENLGTLWIRIKEIFQNYQ